MNVCENSWIPAFAGMTDMDVKDEMHTKPVIPDEAQRRSGIQEFGFFKSAFRFPDSRWSLP
jgi:hypothetical protein